MFSSSMVNFCAVVGCSNRSTRESLNKFYCLPAIVTHQGKETHELSEKQRALWLSRLHQADLKASQYPYVRICLDHFVKSKPPLYEQGDPDWAPSPELGHSSVKVGTSAQGRHSYLLKRNQQKEAFQKQEAKNMEVETEGGEQQGMASQSSAAVEKHVQTDLAARDIECLCQPTPGYTGA